jgi:hypothetical protein
LKESTAYCKIRKKEKQRIKVLPLVPSSWQLSIRKTQEGLHSVWTLQHWLCKRSSESDTFTSLLFAPTCRKVILISYEWAKQRFEYWEVSMERVFS